MATIKQLRFNYKYLVVFLCFLLGLFVVVPVFAGNGSAVLSLAESMVETIFDTSVLLEVAEICTTDVSEMYPEVWSLMKNLVDNVIVPLAYSISGIYLVIAFINVGLQPQQATPSQFIRPIAFFIGSLFLIKYSPTIIVNGIAFAGELAGEIINQIDLTLEDEDAVTSIINYMAMTTSGVVTALVHVGQLLIPYFAAIIINLLIRFQAYAVIIEIFVRAIFMPLSWGPFVTHGFDMQGTRYLRKFIACCLRVVFMIIVAVVAKYMIAGLLTTFDNSGSAYLTSCMAIICIDLAFAAMLKKVGDLSDDMMGVG